MRPFFLFFIVFSLAGLPWTGFAETDWTGAAERSDLPAAAELLAAVRERLPLTPITLKGRLLTGPSLRRLTKVMAIDTALDLSADPAFARITLRDAFGFPAEELTVFRQEGSPAQFTYRRGSPLASSPLPSLYAPIRNTDITWNDLSLSVLWADNAATLGEEKIRGRDCYVLRATADAPAPTLYLWVDKAVTVLLQIEERDAVGTAVRRLTVKSIKKIDDMWMMKNLEVRSLPSNHRTVLQIQEIQAEDGAIPLPEE
ncbi:MAG: outer membrane lipoprotein-sorting protein [Lentisphaerae bacterium]|nr:outer membrane lipoprotein-sorting protein [Lentisphaerota bacterium]